MGFLDRIFGRKEEPQAHPGAQTYTHSGGENSHFPPMNGRCSVTVTC